MVRMWLAKADPDWFDFLAAQPDLDEVNLWAPGASAHAGAMQPGELVLFGMDSPRGTIGGFGVLDRANDYPLSLVWEALGSKNGTASLAQLREKTRRHGVAAGSDHAIACRIVVEPVFLPARLWIPRPAGNGAYDTATTEGRLLWERLHEAAGLALAGSSALRDRQLAFRGPDHSRGERYGAPRLVQPRRGQGAFRLAVTDAYRRQCAISGGKVLPALEAAHIRAYGEGGEHDVANGLLLRRDIHAVFDAGLHHVRRRLAAGGERTGANGVRRRRGIPAAARSAARRPGRSGAQATSRPLALAPERTVREVRGPSSLDGGRIA